MGEPTPQNDIEATEISDPKKTGSILQILEAQKVEALAIEAAKKQLLVIRTRARELSGLVEDQLPVASDFDQNTTVSEDSERRRKDRRYAKARIASGQGDDFDRTNAAGDYDRRTKSIQRRVGKLVGPDGGILEIALERERSIMESETEEGAWVPAVDSSGREITYDKVDFSSLSLTDPADEGGMLVVHPRGIEVYTLQYDFPEFTIFLVGEKGLNVVNQGDDRLRIPDRDPIGLARERIDYFIEHASELKPFQLAEADGQAPSETPPAGTPPAQPAPSV